ncbi:MAG: SGNH/GDSL hydrolase family protein [Pseudomonadota bacterium]
MRRIFAGLTALVLLVGLWLWPLWHGPGSEFGVFAPRDVALRLRALPEPLRITVLGTSLSHNEPWPDQLSEALNACLGPTEITVLAQPGAGVLWGQGQVGAVAEATPDLVLVEFAINDADIRDGLPRAEAAAETRALLAALAEALPGAALVEMTMSPASGLRGVLRPGLAGYYEDVITRAVQGSHGAIDLYARWLTLPRAERGLIDGLHPDPQIAAEVTVAPVRDYIAATFGASDIC